MQAALPEEASEGAWADELERMGRRIQRLGAINLAAIEEYDQESERKQYLDAQAEDLELAMQTLLDAIAKIDRETRSRFKDTFEAVNTKLSELFPKVFGGGHAYLELTGDDMLDTGVSLMAQPPGKRNASVHLLSGGEKSHDSGSADFFNIPPQFQSSLSPWTRWMRRWTILMSRASQA